MIKYVTQERNEYLYHCLQLIIFLPYRVFHIAYEHETRVDDPLQIVLPLQNLLVFARVMSYQCFTVAACNHAI